MTEFVIVGAKVFDGERLVLVDGDATVNIGDTLSIRALWRQDARLALEPVGVRA
jgi:hypothetical protein